jgi:diguanylate cyclase (GGDEF)-like protein
VAAGADARPAPAENIPTSVKALELAAIVPLLGWFAVVAVRDPGTFSDPGLIEWIAAIALVDLLPVPTTVGLPFSLSFPLQLSVALIYPNPVISGLVVFFGSTDWRELRREVMPRRAFWNRAQMAWSVVVEALLFHSLGSLESQWYVLIPAVLLSGIAGYAVNVLLVAIHVRLEHKEPILGVLREMHVGVFGEFLLSYMGLALFSVVVASTFVRIGHWSILVFVAPLLFARQMFTRTHRLHEATVELEAKQQEKEYQALHDALTDLPNRVLFRSRLADVVEAAQEEGAADRVIAVLLIDLDHFKEVNDTLGHHFGDLLLQQIGPRLATTLREHDLMARLGGDEFGIVLSDLPDEAMAVRVAERIIEELERPLSVEGLQLDVSGSIGIAVYPRHSDDVETLMRRADVAMYAAKESGSGYEVYNPSLDRHSAARLTLIGQVRPAIDNHELVLWYQPKLRLSDERVAGVEALVRWMHPERGIVMPDDFIPMVERTVLLRPMTQYLLEQALRQSHAWERMGLSMEMAVNLSPRSLLDQHLPEQVAEELSRWQVPPERLTLELTESFLMSESGRSTGVLAGLSEVGVVLSIDDFGTGYSSLSHLRRLPIREIKIDRSFVTHMREDPNDQMLVRATVDLGRNLGLRVVAEGVETQDTLEELALMGCDMAQGYLLTKPLPPAELTAWLERRGGASAITPPEKDASGREGHRGVGNLHVV